jgi:hypothetical protein
VSASDSSASHHPEARFHGGSSVEPDVPSRRLRRCDNQRQAGEKSSQRGDRMPTYMDMHDIPGVKAEDVAKAHEADVATQGKYGVDYKQYWVNEAEGKVFCLVDSPDKETAARVHREAHGLEAHTLYEVKPGG